MSVKEEWKPIRRYPFYEVSSLGRVRSIDRTVFYIRHGQTIRANKKSVLLRPKENKDGYLVVSLYNYSKEEKLCPTPIHVIVARTFIGKKPKGKVIRHKDGDCRNNVPDNLRYGTSQQNSNDRTKHGRTIMGESHHKARLTERQVFGIRKLAKRKSLVAIAKQYGVTPENIGCIVSRKTWKHVR